MIRGFHVYKNVWVTQLGEILDAVKEDANIHDRFAVAIIHNDLGVVGHVPMKISKLCSAFLSRIWNNTSHCFRGTCALSSGTRWIRHSVYVYVCWRKMNGTAAEEMLAKYGIALFVATVKIINPCLNIMCTVIIYNYS